MEGQQNNQNEKEHSGIEMTCFCSPKQHTKQVGIFPGSAKRLSTDNQRSDRVLDGHQVVRYNPPIQEDAMHDIDIRSGMNRSPGATTSGQRIAQELDQLFPREIQNAGDESYFQEMREFKSLTERGESTQMFDRDDSDTEIVSEYRTCNDETTDDESYFLAESEFQFHSSNHSERPNWLHPNKTEPSREFVYSNKRKPKRGKKQKSRIHGGSMEVDDKYRRSYLTRDNNTSELSLLGVSELESHDYSPSLPRRHLTKPEPTQALVHSSLLNSNPVTKQHRATAGQSPEVDGEYWRRNYLHNNDITSELSCLEHGLPEPKRQWYRSKNMRLQNFQSPSRNYSEDRGLLLLVSIIFFLSVVLLFAFVVLIAILLKYV